MVSFKMTTNADPTSNPIRRTGRCGAEALLDKKGVAAEPVPGSVGDGRPMSLFEMVDDLSSDAPAGQVY